MFCAQFGTFWSLIRKCFWVPRTLITRGCYFLNTTDAYSGFFFFLIFILFLAALGLCCHAWAFPQLQRAGATLRCGAQASHCGGFSCCRARALGAWASVVVARGFQQLWLAGSRAQAQQLWRKGLVAPRHVGSSQTRDRTRVPCIGRRILNHCTTKEAYLFRICLKSFKIGLSCPLPVPYTVLTQPSRKKQSSERTE